MKVIFFVSDFKIGLSHLLLEQVISFKMLDGVEFTFVSGENEQVKGLREKALQNGISVHIIQGLDAHKNFFYLAGAVHRILDENQVDVVHVQNNWQLAFVTYLKFVKRKKFKIIYTVHGYRHNFKIRSVIARYFIMIALLFFTNKVLVCSSYVRKKFFLVKHKSTLLFLGLGERYFSATNPVRQGGKKSIVFAGQFRKGKNQQVIIAALARYINETHEPNIHLHLPGTGPLLESCKKFARSAGIGEFVSFPGQLTNDEVYELYQQCNIAVIPSNVETFGHCIAEPFALGYCVFTRKTGIAEDIILDRVSGLFFNTEDELYNLFRDYLPFPEKLSYIGKNSFKNRDSLRFSKIALQYKSILDGIQSKDT